MIHAASDWCASTSTSLVYSWSWRAWNSCYNCLILVIFVTFSLNGGFFISGFVVVIFSSTCHAFSLIFSPVSSSKSASHILEKDSNSLVQSFSPSPIFPATSYVALFHSSRTLGGVIGTFLAYKSSTYFFSSTTIHDS